VSKVAVVVVVADASPLREQLVADLVRRFGADYEIVGRPGAETAALLDGFAEQGRSVAAVIAHSDLPSAGTSGAELLARVREGHPQARRILLVGRGQWRGHPVRQAMVLGHVDSYLYIPWFPREQYLYLPMSEYLADWSRSRPPERIAVTVVGEPVQQRSHEVREWLTRAGIPLAFHPPDSPAGRAVLADAGEDGSRLPVVAFYTGASLVDPDDAELMGALGFRTDAGGVRCDVLIVGAGPSGLSAAVYAASEGLRTAVLDDGLPGGQAGSSSAIRNYLGFPRGVSGAELMTRAAEQAWLFGAEMLLVQHAVALRADGDQRIVRTADGGEIHTRAVVLATGAAWRRIGVPRLESLIGAGVFYGAASAEADAMAGQQVFVVGGGNSAGQAAVHLAKHAARVTILVRRASLAATMSAYLIREIEATSTITVRPNTDIVDGHGRGRLEALTLRDTATGAEQTLDAAALFIMIGSQPRTDWLAGTLARGPDGHLLTGTDLATVPATGEPAPRWPLARPPRYLETSMPGVFAVGDVRHGSIKRVAPSVGSGGIAIQLVHEYLANG
jgi:thioredoxin reductase (NADPH)